LLRSQRGGLVAVFLLVALGAVSGVAGPYLARNGIDRGMLSGSFRALAVAGGLFAVSALIQYAGTRALLVVAGRVGQRIVHTLRVRVWAHLQRLPIDFFESHRTGDLLTVVVSDVETLSEVLSTGLASIVVATVTSVVALAVMASLNLVMAGVTLGVLVPLVGVVVVCQRLSAASYRRARRRIAEMNTDLEESLSGARESQAFGQQGRRQAKFSEAARGYADARIAAYRLVAIYFPLIDLLSDIGIALLLGVGALLVAGGSLAPGELVAFVLYQAVLFTPIQQAFGFFDSLQQARVSTGRIGALLGTAPDAPAALADDRPRPAEGAAGELRLENVGFRYPDADSDALTGLDLTVRPGETLAVVGASGAGKSTLVKLIARFYDPTSGRLLLGGADLRSLDPSAYRSRLGYVPQEPFLFPVSVRANIAYGRPDATEADVVAAATAVGAHEAITALPGGYDHVVTGNSLSAGQRQLLCLARALLVDPELLLLDEATAGLDETMMGAVARAAAGRTTVMVTHRLRSARDADRVAVLADGRLAELGSHEELLAAGGRYAGMWETARSDTPATAHDPNPDPVPS
jgi:ATP-binding cassette subfamily B protein